MPAILYILCPITGIDTHTRTLTVCIHHAALLCFKTNGLWIAYLHLFYGLGVLNSNGLKTEIP